MLFGKAFGHLLHKSLHYSHKILLPKKIPFSFVIDRKAATTTTHSSSAAKLVKAIRVHQFGGPEVLKYEDVELGEPKNGEIRVKNKAIGLNFVDIQTRKGERELKDSNVPFIPGIEAAGVVTKVGPGVLWRRVGDYVAYTCTPMGAYAEEQIVPDEKVVPAPPSMDPAVAASIMFKGVYAKCLIDRCFGVKSKDKVLIHTAVGGIESLLCQWANACGSQVIGIVSTKEKAIQAKDNGCSHVIVSEEEDFVKRVNEITSGCGVDVVYDSVGKDTFKGSVACLKIGGTMVSFGELSVVLDSVPSSALDAKSLTLIMPDMMQYATDKVNLLGVAEELFKKIESNVLKVRVKHTYPLSQAAQAHADFEGDKTSGPVVLIP